MAGRLIIVSNRLPFRLSVKKGQVKFAPSAGGLVTSLKAYIHKILQNNGSSDAKQIIWVGTPDIDRQKFTAYFNSDHCQFEEFLLHPVFMPEEVKDKHYNGFSNDTLWPLFHYFPSYAKFKKDYWDSYKTANDFFADKIKDIYQPGDLIWVHDYHLLLLPALVRQHIPQASIGFFLHIPFPSFELFRMLPNTWRAEILNGMLGADLVGFHTNDYAQHFLKSVRQLLGFDHSQGVVTTTERLITTDVFAVGVDFEKFFKAGEIAEVSREHQAIRKKLEGLKIIISVDRLDYTKALVNRLESFELFLHNNPQYRGRSSYLMLVVPSRDIITKYKENKREIEETVSRINGRFGSIDWTPVIYQYRSLEINKLTGMYMAADVALITPVRDGMNLVAKEFVASRSDRRGSLILSETAGAAAELGEALLVNPTDPSQISEAIVGALTMPEAEQELRMEAMQRRLQNYNVVKWAGDFIATMHSSHERQEQFMIKELTAQTEKEITTAYARSKRRLILLDYDGTLIPFARLPQQAVPTGEVIGMLQKLAADEQNTVVLISGRPRHTLEQWFGNLPLLMVAEHGAFIRNDKGDWEQKVMPGKDWREIVMQLFKRFTNRCAGSFIEEKSLSLVWHYRNSENEAGFLRSRELLDQLNELAEKYDFRPINGNKVIEVRDRRVDKGSAAKNWIDAGYDFILAMGDDRTDEDMFAVIPPGGFSIKVGMAPSLARYNIKNQAGTLQFLSRLLQESGAYTVTHEKVTA